jgi:hypothetical protein
MWSGLTVPISMNSYPSFIGKANEIQEFATEWMYKYNHQRPNMALGGIPPKQRLAMVA